MSTRHVLPFRIAQAKHYPASDGWQRAKASVRWRMFFRRWRLVAAEVVGLTVLVLLVLRWAR